MDNTDCDVCFHHYDDQAHLPRTLPCGHSLCSQCITDAIRENQMTCPYCRQDHNISNAKEIPISIALLDLSLNKLAGKRQDGIPDGADEISKVFGLQSDQLPDKLIDHVAHQVEPQPIPQAVQNPVTGITKSMATMAYAEPSVHAGVCLKHRSYKLSWCSSCLVWTCQVCSQEDHSLETCRVISIHEALWNLKQEEEVLCASNKEAFLNHSQFLKDLQEKLESRIEVHETQAGLVHALNEGHICTIDQLKREKEQVSASLEETKAALQNLDDVKEHLMKVNTVESIERAQKDLKLHSKMLQEMIAKSKDDIRKLGAMQLSDKLGKEVKMMLIVSGYSFGNPLEDAGYLTTVSKRMFKERITVENIQYLASKKTVWTVTANLSWAAPISLEDGRVHLHCLRQAAEMPPTAYTLPFETVRHLVKKTPEIFIQLSCRGKVHGQFCITLDSKAENHRGILQRCIGESFLSFRNSSVSSHVVKEGKVPAQFYGGIAPTTETFSKGVGQVDACSLGNGLVTLGAVGDLPCFIVWYKPYQLQFPEQRSDIQLGWVTKGLQFVETVAESPGISEYLISDCGLVIG